MKSVNIVSPVGYTGYGYTGFHLIKALMDLDVRVGFFPIGKAAADNQEDLAYLQKGVNNAQFYDKDASCIRIWHQFALAEFVGRGEHIGFPIFELDKFNAIELHHLASVDKLFVCSKWAADIVKNTVNKDAYVVPLGVDSKVFHPNNHIIKTDDFIFLNCGKWEVRKGHHILCDMFNNAFDVTDKVQLWLCPHNPFLSDVETAEWNKLYLNSRMGKAGKIKIFPRLKTQVELANIMNQADCGIFPYSAEGWNLEGLEMLACGKPIIATNYSGPTEYLYQDGDIMNSACLGVSVTDMELAYDGKWFHKQGSWAKIDKNAQKMFIDYMRLVADKRANVSEEAVKRASEFTWDKAAKKVLEAI